MKDFGYISFFVLTVLLSACSPIKNQITTHYQLTAFSTEKINANTSYSLLITPTQALAGYQTEQMQYLTKPYALSSFSKNSWYSPPANMIYSLLIQSAQKSHAFSAVSSGTYVNKTDYQLDTQLIELRQNFIMRPSRIEFKMKAILTRVSDNQIIKSKTFSYSIPCPQDTPYGGVLAANIVAKTFTKNVIQFVVKQIK